MLEALIIWLIIGAIAGWAAGLLVSLDYRCHGLTLSLIKAVTSWAVSAWAVCVWAAGRVFRVGILLMGKGASPVEMARWVFRG